MRRVAALPLVVLSPLVIAACAAHGAPPPVMPPPETSATAASTERPASPSPVVEASPSDPRVVRCGVDDRPKNVVGARGEEDDALPLPFEPAKGVTPSPFLAQGVLPLGFARVVMAKPRPPSVRTVALALPRSAVLFEAASRGGTPLVDPEKTAVVGRRYDISGCIGETTVAKGNVAIELRIASSGAPLEARPKSSDLDERMTHCVVELGCQVAFPSGSSPSVPTGAVEIRAAVSQVQPVFKGSVSVSPSSEGAYVDTLQPSLGKVGQALKPLAESCAKKTPPAQSVSFQQRLIIDDAGLLSLTPPTVGGATEALTKCIAAGLHEAVGPVPTALRKTGALRTSFAFSVSF